MQTKKYEIRQRILLAARDEFCEKGFEKASIRHITAIAKTTKSNIYNYFDSKDALFRAVVEPALTGIRDGLMKLRHINPLLSTGPGMITSQGETIWRMIDFVYKNKNELKMLLFQSSGSSLSEFRDYIIRALSGILLGWVSAAAPKASVSELFTRSVAQFYIGSVEQMLLLDLPPEEVTANSSFFLFFTYGGWKAVLDHTAAF